MIEVKSIYEKADEKVKDDYHQVAALLAELAKNRKDTDKLHDMVENFLNEKKNESK
jgi:hypothetical protein